MTKFSKWILYISSYIPLYIILIVNNILNLYESYKGNKDFSISLLLKEKNINFILFFIILIFISFVLLRISLREASKSTHYEEFFNIKKDNENINYYILIYIFAFIGIDSINKTKFIVFILLFVFIGNIFIKNNLLYIHPMMKYNVFKSEDKILITKYSISELKKKGIWDNNTNKLMIKVSNLYNNIYYVN